MNLLKFLKKQSKRSWGTRAAIKSFRTVAEAQHWANDVMAGKDIIDIKIELFDRIDNITNIPVTTYIVTITYKYYGK